MAFQTTKLMGDMMVWGIPAQIKPLLNAPEGRQRLRFRNRDVGRLFVLTPAGIRHFYIKVVGDHWEPGIELGRNFRFNTKRKTPTA